ncbi:MAG: hypothetical protein N3A69_10145, partial [Leptospiraceae bacterium]|nr:hypothetical protein [Leptospiraceae bacterium]
LKDINKILKDISLEPLDLSDEEIHKYSNVIEARNKIAHDPSYLHEITIGEIIEVLSIGKDILTKIESLVS